MSVSKCSFYRCVEGLECHELVHPWNKNCFMASVELALTSIVGTNKFYNIYYLLQIFLKRDQLTKEYLAYMARSWLKSTLHGTFMSVAWLCTNCIYRNVFGHFNYYVVGLLGGAVGGLGILFDVRRRRALCHTTFYSLIMDILLKFWLERHPQCTHNVTKETLLFMIVNSVLLYSLHSNADKQSHVWFFIPPAATHVSTELGVNNNRTHKHDSFLGQQTHVRQVIGDTIKYFCIGMALQNVSQILTKLPALRKNPHLLTQFLCHKNSTKLALLMSSYVLIYKVTTCWLTRWTNKESTWHSMPAGFLSGASYFFQPNTTILLTAISNLLIISGRRLKTNGYVPNWPFGELAFALCNGVLFHCRVFHPQCCPPFVLNMIDTATGGKSNTIYQLFKKRIQEQSSLDEQNNDKNQTDRY